ncbi:hypothetical protein KSZ_32500 [Dictyobacter formicarum]|uniref:DUF7718 domain-containing protein n=1 Tax=Dictyobacter formicarum TaxID=2778368 RepID=A0ABQ3VGD2_9CHLR|nr:hypothetical protein KSZ_32500 [Dictyobacter formicarum]
MSPEDRITYVYKQDDKYKIIDVTDVSYEIFLNQKWVTILRYDNAHGFHRHLIGSISHPEADVVTPLNISGQSESLLRWAIEDIKVNWWYHRAAYFKRNNLTDS